jgi:hypothetical protein
MDLELIRVRVSYLDDVPPVPNFAVSGGTIRIEISGSACANFVLKIPLKAKTHRNQWRQ